MFWRTTRRCNSLSQVFMPDKRVERRFSRSTRPFRWLVYHYLLSSSPSLNVTALLTNFFKLLLDARKQTLLSRRPLPRPSLFLFRSSYLNNLVWFKYNRLIDLPPSGASVNFSFLNRRKPGFNNSLRVMCRLHSFFSNCSPNRYKLGS